MVKNELDQLQDILNSAGLQSGLRFLNQRVPFRATAIYKLENGVLRLIDIVDKMNDLPSSSLPEVPLADSFCQFAIRDKEFVTANTTADRRLDGHPYQGVVASYVGLPLMKSGELFGTFCHYDFVEQVIEDAEFAFLQDAMSALPKYL
jgi:GAF domain-containing protein